MEINISNRQDVKGIEVKTYGGAGNPPIEGRKFADIVVDLDGGNKLILSFDPQNLLELVSPWADAIEIVTQFLC